MSKSPENMAPSPETAGYGAALAVELGAFKTAGWNGEDVKGSVDGPDSPYEDGKIITVARTLSSDAEGHGKYFWKDGDVKPPAGVYDHRNVYKTISGKWIGIVDNEISPEKEKRIADFQAAGRGRVAVAGPDSK